MLVHSLEVAQLAALMAVELGVNDTIAKRGGLLHDIGKAIDREMEGTHLELGRQVLEKYGEKREIIHAMECHHGDYDPTTVEAVLVNAADALSAARPGARREILENYVHRLERLESIANQMEGVSKSFAIQAGRELRIIVNSEKISDEQSIWLSRDVARKIENELQYPGQIKVTVIAEERRSTPIINGSQSRRVAESQRRRRTTLRLSETRDSETLRLSELDRETE